MGLSSIDSVINDVKEGRPIIIVDSPERENEGDIFVAAEKITVESLGFMRMHATGKICIPMTSYRLDDLGLQLMVLESYEDKRMCRFTITVDYKKGTTTGMSDYDRVATIKALINPEIKLEEFRMPGHVEPLRAEINGLLEREGHTEAAVELARLSGLYKAGVICEIVKPNGEMARMPDLENFSKRYGDVKIVSVEQIKKAIYS